MTKLTESSNFHFIDAFSSLDELRGKDRCDSYKILSVLARVGRFSCFEVDAAMASAIAFICNHSGWVTTKHEETVIDADGRGSHKRTLYPWTYIALTEAGRAALAAAKEGT